MQNGEKLLAGRWCGRRRDGFAAVDRRTGAREQHGVKQSVRRIQQQRAPHHGAKHTGVEHYRRRDLAHRGGPRIAGVWCLALPVPNSCAILLHGQLPTCLGLRPDARVICKRDGVGIVGVLHHSGQGARVVETKRHAPSVRGVGVAQRVADRYHARCDGTAVLKERTQHVLQTPHREHVTDRFDTRRICPRCERGERRAGGREGALLAENFQLGVERRDAEGDRVNTPIGEMNDGECEGQLSAWSHNHGPCGNAAPERNRKYRE